MFKNQLKNSEETFICEKRHNIDKSMFFSETSYFICCRSSTDRCLIKTIWFLTLDLMAKLMTSESSVYEMVVLKVLKSKDDIDLAFFLTLILFRLMATAKTIWAI